MSTERPATAASQRGRRIAVNTAILSIATGVSRVAGLVREIVAASYFGTSGPMSAFAIAFQVPNLLRSLVADAALQAAFIPVFAELMEQGRKREAYGLAAALFGLILAVLGGLTAVFLLVAPVVMPLVTGSGFTSDLDALTTNLSRLLFPIVALLGLNGLAVAVLQAHDRFTVPALAQVVWNVVIIAVLVGLHPAFDGDDRIYAYAIGVLLGTAVQFAMALPMLRRVGIPLRLTFSWRDPRIARVLRLMVPAAIGLGLLNFNLLINSALGSLISDEAPASIDRAFRIYILPHGIFSLAIATVLFPTLSRLAARGDIDGMRSATATGARSIALVLIPSAAALCVLAEPITRLIYQRGDFDAQSTEQVSEALLWFSFSLPFVGLNTLLTRTFFSLQQVRRPTLLAAVTLAVNTSVSAALYEPFGIGGIVVGTAVASAVMAVSQMHFLRRELRGLELRHVALSVGACLLAAALLAGVAYVVWRGLDREVGRSLAGQIVSLGGALVAGAAVYAAVVLRLRVTEARQFLRLLRRREL